MVKYKILQGDVRQTLAQVQDQSVQCVVTSPPYYGLRDYGVDGQIGLEQTPDEYVSQLVNVFREVKRVLKDDGTLWLNLGDSYAATTRGGDTSTYKVADDKRKEYSNKIFGSDVRKVKMPDGIKPKDLIGIPWMVAFALRADGWYLRQDIIWHKPNPMPESVKDRCTKAHEYIFLLTKSQRYYYDNVAIMEDSITTVNNDIRFGGNKYGDNDDPKYQTKSGNVYIDTGKRNKRSVWTVTTKPYSGAHFATFPMDLIEPCILAGSKIGDTVLDPFNGSGTTGYVAMRRDRDYIGCELNADYIQLSRERFAKLGMFVEEYGK